MNGFFASFISWTSRHFRRLCWILFLLMLVPMAKMRSDSRYLILPSSPMGFHSLELSGNDSVAKAIIRLWTRDTVDLKQSNDCSCSTSQYRYRDSLQTNARLVHIGGVARQDAYASLVFTLLYVLFAISLFTGLELYLAQSRQLPATDAFRFVRILTVVILVAAVFDILAVAGMLMHLSTEDDSLWLNWRLIGIFAVIKESLIRILLFIYLPVRCYQACLLIRLSDYLKAKFFQGWRYRVILAGIVLSALPLWFMDQGQDLLVNVNASGTGVILFLLSIGFTAILNWYLAKLFFNDSYKGPLLPFREQPAIDPAAIAKEKKASRFLGVATLLLPAFAILKALDSFKISYAADFFSPGTWLLFFLAIAYIILQGDLINVYYEKLPVRIKQHGTVFLVVALLLLGFAVPGIFLLYLQWAQGSQKINPSSLVFISIDLILLAFAFLIFVSLRNRIFTRGKPAWLTDSIGKPVYAGAAFVIVLFVLLNAKPLLAASLPFNYLALPVLFAGFITYTVVFTVLIRMSQWKKTNISGFLFILFLFLNITITNKYHDLRLRPASASAFARKMPLENYFADWVISRKNEIDTSGGKEYPVFLVNCYGGGIRAASFSTLVVQQLNDSVPGWTKTSQPFEHFVFSYSGASGGTIGASVLCAYRYALLNHSLNNTMNSGHWEDFYNKDFLSPVISSMLGRDVWAAVTGTHAWKDRAAVQEELWEEHLRQDAGIDYEQDYFSYWDTSKASRFEIPLLFSNSVNVDDGLKGILAPVSLRHAAFPATDFVADQFDSTQTVALSTAAFLSARFPMISPTGKTSANHHFMDGGIKENAGAETSENIYIALQKWLSNPDTIRKYQPSVFPYIKNIRLYFLSIANSSHSRTEPDKKVENLFQLTSPLIALYNSGVDGNSRKADSTLRDRYPDRYVSVWPDVDCIPLTLDSCNKYSPALPLGWQISGGALERLRISTEEPRYYRQTGDSIPGFARIRRLFTK